MFIDDYRISLVGAQYAAKVYEYIAKYTKTNPNEIKPAPPVTYCNTSKNFYDVYRDNGVNILI